jgi:hypothetical protein
MPKYRGPGLHKSSVPSLHSSSPQLPKRRNAEISWHSINDSQRSLGSTVLVESRLHDFVVQDSERQESLSFQLAVPEIPKWTNGPDLLVINGHYSSRALGIKKPSPLTSSQLHLIQWPAGFRRFSSRTLHHPSRSPGSPLLDLRSVKVCAPSSNRMVHGIFHHDPTLDDVLPPELLLASDLENFLSLRRLGLHLFQGMSSWISITLPKCYSS